MTRLQTRLCALVFCCVLNVDLWAQSPPETLAFLNGLWFDGASFISETVFSSGGLLTRSRPATVDREIDLKGGFVVPPYGEAHNHNLDGNSQFDAQSRMYLRDGVFYVMNQNSSAELVAPIRSRINIPTGVDVLYSYGGITPSESHVVQLFARHQHEGNLPSHWESPDTHAYFIVDSVQDLETKWPILFAQKPDFSVYF
jgi:hypothetical protein